MSYRTYYFYFTQVTDKKSQFSFKNWWFTTFTTFSLHSWSSLEADFGISRLCDIINEAVFLLLKHSRLRGFKQKKHMKKSEILAFNPLRHWIPNPGVPCSKPLDGSKVDSAFYPSEVDKMSARNFWELSGKK